MSLAGVPVADFLVEAVAEKGILKLYHFAGVPGADFLVEGLSILKGILERCHFAGVPVADSWLKASLRKRYNSMSLCWCPSRRLLG